MTAVNDPREPLDAQERDLAARLASIGPFDGPSPSLDAKILAAAHAAAATRSPRQRRRLWIGVPPALVTGVGMAAAAVLALGMVWQLRPRITVLPVEGQAGSDEEFVVMAEPAKTARAPVVNPPPFTPHTSPQPAPVASASAQRSKTSAPARASDSRAEAAAHARSAFADTAYRSTPTPEPQPPVESTPSSGDASSSEQAGVAVAPPAAPEAESPRQPHRTSYTLGARAAAERRERAAAMPAPSPQSSTGAASTAAASAAEHDSARHVAEDVRIGTGPTGNGAPVASIPVGEDARLQISAWLERIRARRDAGDLTGARESLRRFLLDHPGAHIPDDLRALADAPRPDSSR